MSIHQAQHQLGIQFKGDNCNIRGNPNLFLSFQIQSEARTIEDNAEWVCSPPPLLTPLCVGQVEEAVVISPRFEDLFRPV